MTSTTSNLPLDSKSIPKKYSKIKNIYFPLRNYKFDHGLNETKGPNKKFIGREKIKTKLKLLLEQRDTAHGAYLVTGYRGMGKTSMVREVINEINSHDELLCHFEFSLSQDEVKDIDLLKQVGWKLHDHIHTKIKPERLRQERKDENALWKKKGVTILFSILLLNLIYNTPFPSSYSDINYTLIRNAFMNPFKGTSSGGYVFLYFGIITFIIYLINLFCENKKISKNKNINNINNVFNRLFEKSDLLNKRLYSSLTQENQNSASKVNLGSHNPISYMTNKILEGGKSMINNKKDTIIFSVATPKEIEKYIIDILSDLRILRNDFNRPVLPFVFIIDELDKVEPDYFFAPGDRESDKFIHHNDAPFHIPTKARMRQEAIAKLLANLKNFLNNAEAKFVFIGGRGMYDASLADIADRESFYSSIFHEVIYVESFFKDKLTSQAGISQITESYLCSLLMEARTNPKDYNIKELISEYEKTYKSSILKLDKESKIFKILHTLQNFIIFLTYRSNGSPKKLIELIERYLVLESQINKKNSDSFCLENLLTHHPGYKEKMYLKLSFRDQFEINLNANFYRPYLIINSKYLKSLGDKLLYSTAFLIDHILKFHKVAFSWRNLELIPDIILSNKDANFRQFYTDIMRFLLRQHLRKTVNAVFQYKFNSKIANEIRFLSKTSEFSSAAFNFTLDESYHLKSYYKKKLAAKYKEYHELSALSHGEGYIHSIGYLHSILGDLHYYDEEYDDAIVHYTDSVQALGQEFIKNNKLLSHQFVLYTRNKLNLGLCLEKTRSYDKAYSVYRSLIIQLQSFQNKSEVSERAGEEESMGLSPRWETPFKRMQLFLRPHVALLNVIEKQRQDGITYDNLERNLQEYLRFLMLDVEDKVKLFPIGLKNNVVDYRSINIERPKKKKEKAEENKKGIEDEKIEERKKGADKKRLTSLITDYYFSVGGMLFFKNQIFYRLLYREDRKGDLISDQIKNRMTKNTSIYHPSHAAYLYYLHALISFNAPFHENIKKIKESTVDNQDLKSVDKDKIHSILSHLWFTTNYLNPDIYRILNSNQYDVLANICAKLGDTILGCLNFDDLNIGEEKEVETFIAVVNLFSEETINFSNKKVIVEDIQEKLSLNLVFILFRLSYLFYMEAGKSYSANFQYKKLLYVLNDRYNENVLNNVEFLKKKEAVKKYQVSENINKNQKEPKFLMIDEIASILLKKQVDITGVSNRAQLRKYRKYTEEGPNYQNHIYQNLSTAPEVKEIIILVESLKMKIYSDYEPKISVGPYATVSSMFTRTLELKYQSDIEIRQLNKLLKIQKGKFTEYVECVKKGKSDKITEFNNLLLKQYDSIIPCLANAYFCLNEVIRILNTYGVSYILTHSFLAAMNKRMGIVSFYVKQLIRLEKNNETNGKNDLSNIINDLVGDDYIYNIDSYHYWDLARLHYSNAIKLHTEGSIYKDFSQGMYTLDDDFNDNLTHFCAASERYRVNTQRIKNQIKKVETYLQDSKLYKYEMYYD